MLTEKGIVIRLRSRRQDGTMGTADSSQLETLIKPETLIDWGASASNLPRWPARRAAKQESGEQDNEHSKDNRTSQQVD